MFYLLKAALFDRPPQIGSTDCSGEIAYRGYERVRFFANEHANLAEIAFPPSDQDGPVLATHAAVIDWCGVIVGSAALDETNVEY